MTRENQGQASDGQEHSEVPPRELRLHLNRFAEGLARSLGADFDGSCLLTGFVAGSDSPRNAIEAARACELVYKDQQAIEWELTRSGFANGSFEVFEDPATETKLFAIDAGAYCLLAFRGTYTRTLSAAVRNWNTNLQVCKASSRDPARGAVHGGFLGALARVWRPLRRWLQRHDPTWSKRVWFTGHSLGGALALLCAVRLVTETSHQVTGVYTYGQPRVGDRLFRRHVARVLSTLVYVRYVNHTDPVPFLPSELLQGYRHTGEFRYINDQGELNNQRGFWGITYDRGVHYLAMSLEFIAVRIVLRTVLPMSFRRSVVEDHGCGRYIAALKAIEVGQPLRERRGIPAILFWLGILVAGSLLVVPVFRFLRGLVM